MTRPTPRAAALVVCTSILPLTVGCGDAELHVRPERALAPAPSSRGELRVESEQPLTFGVLVSAGEGTAVATDRITNDVWLLDGTTSELRLQRVMRGDERVRARLLAVAGSADEWRLLDRAGRVHVFERSSWAYRGTSEVRYGGGTIMSAAGGPEGGFALLIRKPSERSGGIAAYALVLVSPDGTARQTWSTDEVSRAVGARTADLLSVSASGGGWIVSGSEPPRALRFSVDGQVQGEDTFLSVPGRRLSPAVLEQFERTAAAAGVSGTVRAPKYYPALTALRRVGEAYLAVPYVGGPTGEAQGLDVYCGLRYSGTLLDSPDILQVLLSEQTVLVVSAREPMSFAVDMYRIADLPLSCDEAQ